MLDRPTARGYWSRLSVRFGYLSGVVWGRITKLGSYVSDFGFGIGVGVQSILRFGDLFLFLHKSDDKS